MRRLLTTALTACTLAAPLVVAAPTSAHAASEPKPVPAGNVTYRVDVDGDSRPDTVTFRLIARRESTDRFRLTTRTATGRSASLDVRAEDVDQKASDVWVGATGIDGMRGNEIVLNLVTVGDATDIRSYAWRAGKIVPVAAPGRPARWPDWHLMWVDFGRANGWTFSQGRSGIRYVTYHDLKGSPSGRTFTGTNTLYRWQGTGWRKLSVKRVQVTRKVAASLTDLNGLVWR